MKPTLSSLMSLCLLVAALGQDLASHISKVALAKDNGKNKPGVVVKGFSPRDNPLHCVVYLHSMPTPGIVSGTLIAVNAGKVKDHKVATTNISLVPKMDFIDFTFRLPRAWPAGSYKVEVRSGGKLVREIAFSIK